MLFRRPSIPHALAALLALGVASAPVHAQVPEEIAALARSGATELALHMVDRHQPRFEGQPTAWMAWEQARIELYRATQRWADLVARAERQPAELPAEFRLWVLRQQIEAQLELGHADRALESLRRVLWLAAPTMEPEALSPWRRLVIHAYLASGRVADAQVAMLRYRQDFGDGSEEWRLLQARVMLRAGLMQDVAALVGGIVAPDARLLVLLAELRGGERRPPAIARAARDLAEAPDLSPAQRYRAWALAAEAAERAQDHAGRAQALEQALSQPLAAAPADGLFEIEAEQLWQAYLEFGRAAGNELQLLLGQDREWYEKAREVGEKLPLRSRALYAVLANDAFDPEVRGLAHLQLALSLQEQSGGEALLRALYLRSRRFASLEAVPVPVRHRLADLALGRSEIELASRLMRGLDQAPAGVEPVEWELRRARVLIFAGDAPGGVRLLNGLLERASTLSAEQADRLLQVVFDLQNVGQHEAALELFAGLGARDLDEQRRRELLFWIADSQRALGRHADAAAAYLRSATLLDPFSMDRWAQSARYQAARSLVEAGLYGDARRTYQSLLNATREPGRRAVLQREMQQLQLREGAGSSAGEGAERAAVAR